MQAKKDRGKKTETLSLRLDPKTKFILDFVSRIRGQTITTVVERAIRDSSDAVKIYREGPDREGSPWQYFWDTEDGVRTLKLCAEPDYPTTYEEDELMSFVKFHKPFFYVVGRSDEPNRGFVQMLWPKIEEYQRIWRDERGQDYWAAGKAMAADLRAANLKPPSWPPEKKPDQAKELDDEIPF